MITAEGNGSPLKTVYMRAGRKLLTALLQTWLLNGQQMPAETPQILPLSVEAVAQLKSSIAISSQECVVVGLVENALDASAHKIEVSVDFRRGSCCVEDDGCGILPIEFSATGGLGKPFCMLRSQLCQTILISDFTRHLKERSRDCRAWRPGDLLVFAGCIICSDTNIPPPRSSFAFDFDSASFKTCRETGASAETSFSFKSRAWYPGPRARSLWEYAGKS